MKKAIALASLVLLFAGCKKNDILTTKFKATVGTESWTSSINVSTKYSDKFILSGTSSTGKVLALTINGTEKGTYILSTTSFQFAASYNDGTNNYIATSGTASITSVNTTTKKVSGTFNFNAINSVPETITISNGEFTELLYTEVSQ